MRPKRYLVFAGIDYYPCGGWSDYQPVRRLGINLSWGGGSMDKNILAIAATMLQAYAKKLANNGCNDWEWPCIINQADRVAITSQMLIANNQGDPLDKADYELLERYTTGDDGPPDWWIAAHVGDKLAEMAK